MAVARRLALAPLIQAHRHQPLHGAMRERESKRQELQSHERVSVHARAIPFAWLSATARTRILSNEIGLFSIPGVCMRCADTCVRTLAHTRNHTAHTAWYEGKRSRTRVCDALIYFEVLAHAHVLVCACHQQEEQVADEG